MLYFNQAILCLFLTSNFLLVPQDSIQRGPLDPRPIPDDIRKRLDEQRPQQSEQKEVFDEDEIEEMEMVLEAAPLKAQFIPKHLEDPQFFPGCEKFRSAYFIGAPGTGKTIAAKAIAYKMSQKGWNCHFISSTELVEGYRNQTCMHIRNELAGIVSSGKPTLIIIDELNRLLENSDSTHHDTDMSATALWSFLDKQLKNPNFFLIGTMNSAEKLPQAFKNRINAHTIPFQSKASPELKIKHLRKKLTNKNSRLHTEITDEFLKNELERIESCYGRGLMHLAMNIAILHKMNTNETPAIITKKSVINGINEYLSNEETLKSNTKTETDEERQERYHKENIALQEQHHIENFIGNVIGNVAAHIIVKGIERGAVAVVQRLSKPS